MRIKSRWNKRAKPQNLEDIGGAVGYISWQIAAEGILELENQGYTTESNLHRLEIAKEILAFLLQVADRLTYDQLEQAERQRFITAVAMHIANTYASNKQDFLGQGDFKAEFIDFLNQSESHLKLI